MTRGFFITGTDTDVGKTVVALKLISAFQQKGHTVAAMKPVSAGCEKTGHGLRNHGLRTHDLHNNDAVQLMQQASIELPYDTVNPYAFEPAIAPHIAATETNVEMNIDTLVQAYQKIARQADIVIVEGAGGWLVPFNATQTMADVASALKLDIILVVGLKLGCISHTLLTAQSIMQQNQHLAGWVSNHIQPNTLRIEKIEATLRNRLPAPQLGSIRFGEHTTSDEQTPSLTVDALG